MMPPPRRRLRDTDSAERSSRIRLAIPAWLFIYIAAAMLHRAGKIDRGERLLLVWVAGPLLAWAIGVGGSWLLERFARGMIASVVAQGGDRPARGYSEQEALVISGRTGEAIDSFRSLLVAYPDDLEARIRLAALLADSGDLAGAERHYLEARSRRPTEGIALRVSTGLAALHRAAGDTDALRTELAECVRRFAGTASGEHARHELEALDRSGPAPPPA
jgi:tetratricopeptide (TPR) repeat protein